MGSNGHIKYQPKKKIFSTIPWRTNPMRGPCMSDYQYQLLLCYEVGLFVYILAVRNIRDYTFPCYSLRLWKKFLHQLFLIYNIQKHMPRSQDFPAFSSDTAIGIFRTSELDECIHCFPLFIHTIKICTRELNRSSVMWRTYRSPIHDNMHR